MLERESAGIKISYYSTIVKCVAAAAVGHSTPQSSQQSLNVRFSMLMNSILFIVFTVPAPVTYVACTSFKGTRRSMWRANIH